MLYLANHTSIIIYKNCRPVDNNEYKVRSIVAIIVTSASITFVSSSALTNPVLAQSTGGDSSSSASGDYKKFQSCLSDAESNGIVTEQQIRDCFESIYGNSSSSSRDDTGDTGNNDNNPDTEDGK